MEYRREIDGLRAVAVVPVILFHAGLERFRGGYVGVDVFFVISGYLIASLILAEMRAGTFSVLNFYERRARRILPPLFFVSFACIPFAWMWLLPGDMKEFSQSLIAVASFASNILFWRQSNYFGTAAELKPLLHTWSLAVEEQYYLIFPVVLMMVWRPGRKWVVGALFAVALASLAIAEWGSSNKPSATFYLLPTRGWELLIGILIAFHRDAAGSAGAALAINGAVRQSAGLAGLLLIAFSVATFDKTTPFPGLYALVPTIGAALVILYSSPQTIVGKLLGSRILVGVGLISYSAYLWHFPVLAFAKYRGIDSQGGHVLAVLALSTFPIAWLSWKYVETPFRDKRRFGRREIFGYGLVGALAMAGIGASGHLGNGFIDRLSREQQEIYRYTKYEKKDVYRDRQCFLEPDQSYREFADACEGRGARPTMLVWGDSHAAALYAGLLSVHPNVMQFTASGCPPIMDAVVTWRPSCREINEFVLGKIARIKPDWIVLHSNWLLYREQEPGETLRRTIEQVRKVSPATRITIVGGVPQWQPSLPVMMLRLDMTLRQEAYLRTPVYGEIEELDARFDRLAKLYGIDFVSAIGHLCRSQECQVVMRTGDGFSLTAWDYGHLTIEAARHLAEKVVGQ